LRGKGFLENNQRKSSRIQFSTVIRLIKGGDSYEEYLANISKGGCKIITMETFEIGSQLTLAFNDPGKGFQDFPCVVKSSVPIKVEFPKAKSNEFYCYTCHFKASPYEEEGGIRWKGTESEEFWHEGKDYSELTCPKCGVESFKPKSASFNELGLEFLKLSDEKQKSLLNFLDSSMDNQKKGRRISGRIDASEKEINVEYFGGEALNNASAKLINLSVGGLKLKLDRDLEVGQNIKISLQNKEGKSFPLESQIIYKNKISTNWEYGLRFNSFDLKKWEELNIFFGKLVE